MNGFSALGFGLIALGAALDWHKSKQGESRGLAGTRGRGRRGLGDASAPGPNGQLPGGPAPYETRTGNEAGIRRTETYRIKGIDERCAYIRKWMVEGSYDPKTIAAARKIVTRMCGDQYCVAPKDYAGEARALYDTLVQSGQAKRAVKTMFDNVQKPTGQLALRYTRDHAMRDQFSTTQMLRRIPAGDCDDAVIWLGAHLLAIGFCPEMVVIQSTQSSSWDHIYLQVTLDDGTKMPLDTTEPHPAGWEVPKNMVVKKKVIPVCR